MKLAGLVVLSIVLASVISLPFKARSEREMARFQTAGEAWAGKLDTLARRPEFRRKRHPQLPPPPAPPMRTFYLGYLASTAGAMLPWGAYFALGKRRRAAKVTFAVECVLFAMIFVPFATSGYLEPAFWFLGAALCGECLGFVVAYYATRTVTPPCAA